MDQNTDLNNILRKEFGDFIPQDAKIYIKDRIIQYLNLLISEGHLKPGDQLPSDKEFAERFKVSRNTVRDTLRALEAKGLIEIRHGGEAFVSDIRISELSHSLIEILATRKELTRQIMQLRQIIEPGVVFYAAKNPSPEKYLKSLEEILLKHEVKAALGDPGVAEDSMFHFTIAQMTGNQYLIWVLQLINESLEETRDLLSKEAGSDVRFGHRRILDALKNRDPDAARNAMMSHLEDILRAYDLYEGES